MRWFPPTPPRWPLPLPADPDTDSVPAEALAARHPVCLGPSHRCLLSGRLHHHRPVSPAAASLASPARWPHCLPGAAAAFVPPSQTVGTTAPSVTEAETVGLTCSQRPHL